MRIEENGGRVVHFGTWRVEGVLADARAFGDRHLKKYMICDPEIRCRTLNASQDLFLILASDGVWDVLSNSDAGKLALTVWNSQTYATSTLKSKLQAIAGRITTAAFQTGRLTLSTYLSMCLMTKMNNKNKIKIKRTQKVIIESRMMKHQVIFYCVNQMIHHHHHHHHRLCHHSCYLTSF